MTEVPKMRSALFENQIIDEIVNQPTFEHCIDRVRLLPFCDAVRFQSLGNCISN